MTMTQCPFPGAAVDDTQGWADTDAQFPQFWSCRSHTKVSQQRRALLGLWVVLPHLPAPRVPATGCVTLVSDSVSPCLSPRVSGRPCPFS